MPNIQMLNHKIIKSESTFGRRSSSAQCEALSDDGLFTLFTPYHHHVQESDVKAAKSPPPPPPPPIYFGHVITCSKGKQYCVENST